MADPLPASTPRRFVLKVMWLTRGFAIPAGLSLAVHQVCEALVPVLMGRAIDSAVVDGDVGLLVIWLALLAVNFAVLATSYRFGSWFGQLGAESMQHHIRTTVTGRLLHPRAWVDRPPGAALSLATHDVRRVTRAIALMVYPVGQLAAVLAGGAFLLAQSVPLGLAVLVGAPLMLLLLDLAGRPLRRRARREAEAIADASGIAADLIDGHRVLDGIRAVAAASGRYRVTSREALEATLRARRSEVGLSLGLEVLTGLFVVAIAVAAGLLALGGTLSVGQLITVVGLTQFLMGPLINVASDTAPIWASAQASAVRVLEVVGEPDGRGVADMATARKGALVLDGVVVPGADPLTLELGDGEVVGLTADETVMASLTQVLAARRRPEAGSVWAGGIPVDADDPEPGRRNVLVAPHEAHLFDGTIAENVDLVGVDPASLADALHASACDDVIAAVHGGIDARVGDGGLRLSGGQRQRVALARALAADPPVLVLHEPTSAVDSVTEQRIATRLRELRQGRATLLLTRSPALLSTVDRVIDLGVST